MRRRKRASYKYFNDKDWIESKMILLVQAQMVVIYFHRIDKSGLEIVSCNKKY
jgi:hypothetical protein